MGGVDASITEDDVRDAFYSFGELASVRKVRALSRGGVCASGCRRRTAGEARRGV